MYSRAHTCEIGFYCLLAVWRGLRPANPCLRLRLAPPEVFLGSAGKGRFFVRPDDPKCRAQPRSRMAGGHRACAARSVLDGGERGARLEQDGPHREDAEGADLNDTTLMQQALGLLLPWTVVGAHFDADYRRRMKSVGCLSSHPNAVG